MGASSKPQGLGGPSVRAPTRGKDVRCRTSCKRRYKCPSSEETAVATRGQLAQGSTEAVQCLTTPRPPDPPHDPATPRPRPASPSTATVSLAKGSARPALRLAAGGLDPDGRPRGAGPGPRPPAVRPLSRALGPPALAGQVPTPGGGLRTERDASGGIQGRSEPGSRLFQAQKETKYLSNCLYYVTDESPSAEGERSAGLSGRAPTCPGAQPRPDPPALRVGSARGSRGAGPSGRRAARAPGSRFLLFLLAGTWVVTLRNLRVELFAFLSSLTVPLPGTLRGKHAHDPSAPLCGHAPEATPPRPRPPRPPRGHAPRPHPSRPLLRLSTSCK